MLEIMYTYLLSNWSVYSINHIISTQTHYYAPKAHIHSPVANVWYWNHYDHPSVHICVRSWNNMSGMSCVSVYLFKHIYTFFEILRLQYMNRLRILDMLMAYEWRNVNYRSGHRRVLFRASILTHIYIYIYTGNNEPVSPGGCALLVQRVNALWRCVQTTRQIADTSSNRVESIMKWKWHNICACVYLSV